MLPQLIRTTIAVLALLTLASCGGTTSGLFGRGASGGFELRVLPESFALGGSADISVATRELPDGVVVAEVTAANADGLKALYCQLDYDASNYTPLSAGATAALANTLSPATDFGERVLELAMLDDPGTVHLGQVLVHPNTQRGLHGDAVLATVRFATRRDGRSLPARGVSTAPATNASRCELTHDAALNMLRWGYYCNGDYDQNGLVTISDLSPLALYFQQAGGPFATHLIQSVVDGDSNGEINLADITSIGVNFGRSVESYNLYASANAADYPATNVAASALTQTGSVPYTEFEGTRTAGRLQFSLQLGEHPDLNYWVRPADAAGEGTSSNLLFIAASNNRPYVQSIIAGAQVIDSATSTSIDVVASDADGDALNYGFSLSAGSISGVGASVTFTAPSVTVDTLVTITATVDDGKGASDSEETSVLVIAPIAPPPPVWNLMVWIAGDNNLAFQAVDDLNEMEEFGSTDDVRIFAGFDIDPTWTGPVGGIDQVHFIKVVQDSDDGSINVNGDPANMSFPRAGYDSSDPAHVRAFVDWVSTNFPAQNTALILWNHGDGWLPGNKTFSMNTSVLAAKRKLMERGHNQLLRQQGGFRSTSGVLGDDIDGAFELSNNESIAAALGGLHFDVLAFDACNMGQLEALYDYRSLADVLVGSECLVPGTGLPYTNVLSDFNGAVTRDSEQLCTSIVDEFVAHYAGMGQYAIMSSFTAAEIDALTTALASFAAEVTGKAGVEGAFVQQAITDAFAPDAADGSRDLLGFLESYASSTADGAIQSRIAAVQSALSAAQINFAQFSQPGSTGLGVWLPDGFYFDPYYRDQYEGINFNTATGWLDMLEATGVPGGGGGGGYDVEADWASGDYIQLEWGDTMADVDLGTTDPDGLFWSPYLGPGTANMDFSADSYDSGQAREWAQLKGGASQGDYYIDVAWFDYGGVPPLVLDVSVKLYDSGMQLKEDLGVCSLNLVGDYAGYAKLHLN